MDIIIHSVDGSVSTYHGLPDHLELEDNLPLRYDSFPEIDSPYWWAVGECLAVRHEDEEYEDGEYDYAEIM